MTATTTTRAAEPARAAIPRQPMSLGTLRADLMAGLTVALMGIPQAMAYALIAGLPVRVGLYAAIVPPIVAAIFGSSRYLITGPTNATAMLIFSLIAPLLAAAGGDGGQVLGAVYLLCLVSGVILLAAGLLKLGQIIRYVAQSAMTGFLAGAGVLIIIEQIKHAAGIYPSGQAAEVLAEAFPSLAGVAERLPAPVQELLTVAGSSGLASAHALGVFLVSFGLMWGILRYNRKLPAVLITLAIVSAGVVVLGWHDGTVVLIGDRGHIPPSLPPLTLPLLTPANWSTFLSGGAALALLGMIEAVTIAKGLAARTGDHLNVNKELVGQGLAKVAAGFTGGMVPSGSQTRSALNMLSGAQTRFGQAACGLWTALIVILLAAPAGYIPIPALAAVVIYSALGLIDLRQIRRVLTGTRSDALVLIATLLAAVLLRLDRAIYIGAGLSVLMALRNTSRLVISEMVLGDDQHLHERRTDAQTGDSAIVVLQLEGALYFGAADELEAYLRQVAAKGPDVIILRLKRAHHLDVTIAERLRLLAADLRQRGISLVLCGLRPEVADLLERTGLAEAIGRQNLLLTDRNIFGSVWRALERGSQIVAGRPERGDRPLLRRGTGDGIADDYVI